MVRRLRHLYVEKIRPRAKKIVAGFLIFFVVFTLTGFFVLPPLMKSVLASQLSKGLNREVAIKQIRINPYALSVAVRGLTVKDRVTAETFVSCDEIFLNLQTFSALRMALVFKEIRLKKPYAKITRHQDLSYNFSDLIDNKEPVPIRKEKSAPFRFSLNNITIDSGSIDFLDEPNETKHTIRELKLAVPFLSNIPSHVEIFVQPYFSAIINNTLHTIQGKTKPFDDSLETSVDIDIRDFNIPHYLAYLPIKLPFKITSAYFDTQTKLSFIQKDKTQSSLTITGNASLKKLEVNDKKDKPFLRLPLLDVSISSLKPLSKTIHLSKVSIQSPELEISRDQGGSLNAQSLLPPEGELKTAPAKGKEAPPLALQIDQIHLAGGKISFSDLSTAKPFRTVLHPVELKIDNFSNGKDKKAVYALSARTEAQEVIKADGDFSLEALESEGKLAITSVPLGKYSPFYSDKVLFAVESGRLDFSTGYRYAKGEKVPEITLSAISAALTALRLKKAGEDKHLLNIPGLSITETELDLTKGELKIGNVSTQKGELNIKRLRNGDLNFATLVPPASVPESPSKGPGTGGKASAAEKPWLVSLKQLSVDDYTVRVEDQTTVDPAVLTAKKVKLKGENISTAKNSKGKLALSLLLNGRGRVSTTGTVGLKPLSVEMKTDLKGIEIAPFQPYFNDKVKITVTRGGLSAAGSLSFASDAKKEMKGAYKGDIALTNFSSIDKVNGQDVVNLESLSLNGLHVVFAPFSIDLKGVSLTNFYAHVLVNSKGKINLQEIFSSEESKLETVPSAPGPQETGAEHPRETPPARNIKIDQVTLQGGRIDFVDESVKPEFSTRLSGMGGRISGLSAQENATADVELLTKLNDYAPLEITGKINPLSRNLFVDLKARIKDWDLSPATPYSGKYAGYTIEKGKLSFDLKYLISGGKLDSQNSIFIDQFTFGEKVDSPSATGLPVKLAVALLKDRNGQIKLDLPVTGSLNDPQFSVWSVIVKILVNLIAKAAASPFALLGAAFGGGEDLSYVTFDYGSSVIPESDLKKLNTVSKALHDRPSLKLDIQGRVDMEKDAEGLKRLLFNRKIKTQKFNELTRKGGPAPPVDEVIIETAEYEKYLKKSYGQEKFPKPKNFLGLAKDIPVLEMEKLMLTHIVVNEGDLRTLASQRAMKAKELILKSGLVEPERVFIVEPKSLASEKKDNIKESRVDFRLK